MRDPQVLPPVIGLSQAITRVSGEEEIVSKTVDITCESEQLLATKGNQRQPKIAHIAPHSL